MKVLAVIPARGGSKGIPRKNVRLMNGKPLIGYAIENAKSCNLITDVVVSTDDNEITDVALYYGADVIKRDESLAGDKITLDPVVHDAVVRCEAKNNCSYDIVVTLQPTSPLMKPETLQSALETFIQKNCETIISVVNRPHLSWGKNENGEYYPNYKARLNRQLLPPNYFETGAFFITQRRFVTENSRMGNSISVFEVPEVESTDIDSVADWVTCEAVLRRKKIVFRCDGYRMLGMGHIAHCLTLAYNMTEHDVLFVTREDCHEGLEKIKNSNMKYATIKNDTDFFGLLSDYHADIVVNDCLDTTDEYITELKKYADRIVTIEDLGTGIYKADAVINALYENKLRLPNVYSGEKYACLRDEFSLPGKSDINDEVKNILVLFGGTDPSNLTKKVYGLAHMPCFRKYNFTFLIGVGYNADENGIVSEPELGIEVVKGSNFISSYMRSADIAITSQGRTVFELATVGVPSIVMAQNEREMSHTFAQMDNGFLNLGLGANVSDETLKNTLCWLIDTPQIRNEMFTLMKKHDLRNGIRRVISIILNENIGD